MSKVNTKIIPEVTTQEDFYHSKKKMMHCLRRKETALINQTRMNNAGHRKYSYKYHICDEKYIYERYKTEVPEQIIDIKHTTHEKVPYQDSNGKTLYRDIYKTVITGQKIIPAHTVTKSKFIGTEPVKPYVKRWSDSGPFKKYIKTLASRKIRHLPLEETVNNSKYKRLYDMAWSLY